MHFGPWRLQTPLSNIDAVSRSGGFKFHRTAGPPHLSFVDHGITFATNRDDALCIELSEPVRGIEPTGRIRHPGVTLTVADVPGLRQQLRL